MPLSMLALCYEGTALLIWRRLSRAGQLGISFEREPVLISLPLLEASGPVRECGIHSCAPEAAAASHLYCMTAAADIVTIYFPTPLFFSSPSNNCSLHVRSWYTTSLLSDTQVTTNMYATGLDLRIVIFSGNNCFEVKFSFSLVSCPLHIIMPSAWTLTSCRPSAC